MRKMFKTLLLWMMSAPCPKPFSYMSSLYITVAEVLVAQHHHRVGLETLSGIQYV